MLRPDGNPFGYIVGMDAQNVFFQSVRGPREKLETQAKLFRAFNLSLPVIMRDDRAIDLHASGQPKGKGFGRESVSIGAPGNGGPSKQHEGTVSRVCLRRKS